jgi:DNA-binding transcriptional LysR family regulator
LPIDLRSTEAFVRVVESGSMTAAAALGVTQPAVLQMMARLEANLGVPLFERGTRPLMLTPAGEELAARAPKLLTQGDQLQAAVRNAAHASRSVVRIGLIDSFASTAGPPLIRHLRKTAERLSIWSGISPTLGDDLLARKLDLVVSSDPMTKHRNIGRRRLLVELRVNESMA